MGNNINFYLDMTTVREFMALIEADMKVNKGEFDKYVEDCEKHYLHTVAQLRRVREFQWVQLDIPIGIVNEMIDKLEKMPGGPMAIQSSASMPVLETLILAQWLATNKTPWSLVMPLVTNLNSKLC